MKTYCFDLDGTLCSQERHYINAVPFRNGIDAVNDLYYKGNKIIIFTARGASSGIDWTRITTEQLEKWGLKYHELVINKKPSFDILVDDKAINAEDWLKQVSKPYSKGVLAGAFDLIHPGYIRMFEEAKDTCRHLTVLLHTDPVGQRKKMPPVHTTEERAEILKSIKWIDEVVYYSTEEELESLLVNGRYNVRYLGDDYKGKGYTAKHLSIQIIFLDRTHGYSTTLLKEKITDNLIKWRNDDCSKN